jgi:hypothetical protein
MPLGYCEAISAARKDMPLMFVASNCQQTLQTTMYGAAAAVNGNNAAGTAATLGMLQVETGCGTAQPSTIGCDGTYGARAQCNGCTAYGAGQIINSTWKDLTTGSNLATLKKKLGGCSGVTSGSLLDPNVTKDGIVRGQFNAFRDALCTNPSSVTNNQAYWGKMTGVSVLTASLLNGQGQGILNSNSQIGTQLNSLGVNSQGVAMYATHNLGAGGGKTFLNALAKSPNASVTTVLSAQVINNNPGLYCVGGKLPCQPLTLGGAAQRMNNSMFSGECTKEGMAALQGQLKGEPGPMQQVNPDGVIAQPGVNTQIGLDNVAALLEYEASGGPAGAMNPNACPYTASGSSCMRHMQQKANGTMNQ